VRARQALSCKGFRQVVKLVNTSRNPCPLVSMSDGTERTLIFSGGLRLARIVASSRCPAASGSGKKAAKARSSRSPAGKANASPALRIEEVVRSGDSARHFVAFNQQVLRPLRGRGQMGDIHTNPSRNRLVMSGCPVSARGPIESDCRIGRCSRGVLQGGRSQAVDVLLSAARNRK
jgi:hypothetical protein